MFAVDDATTTAVERHSAQRIACLAGTAREATRRTPTKPRARRIETASSMRDDALVTLRNDIQSIVFSALAGVSNRCAGTTKALLASRLETRRSHRFYPCFDTEAAIVAIVFR